MPESTPATPYLRSVEAAAYLNISPRTLDRWRMTGQGPAFARINGRVVRYALDELDQWMQSNTARSTSEERLHA